MSHILGVYYKPEHHRKEDRDYIRALQPPVIRILDPDVQHIADMHALAPNAIIAPRTWVIDDNDNAAVRNLMAEPVVTGHDHAQQYRGQLDRWQREAAERGLRIPDASRIMFNSVNEPNQGGTPERIAVYSVAFLDRCTELGIRASAPCLGVGWPDNTGKDTPVDWRPYAALEPAIKRGQHWLAVHEYFYKTGPQYGWRWWAGRHLQCPFDVPILLGEIGIDNYVANERWKQDGGPRGWVGNVSPEQYAEMIEYHLRGCDTRVVAGLPFITDFNDPQWASFDTHAAHAALLARKDRMVPQVKFGGTSGDAKTMYVNSPDGLKIRTGPGLQYPPLDTGLTHGTQVTVHEVVGGVRKWARIDGGWVAHWLLSETEPEPVVAPGPVEPVEPVEPTKPTPTGIIDPLAGQAILQIESGGQAFGPGGRLLIRFENHLFLDNTGDRFSHLFRHGSPRWTGHMWRISASASWRDTHVSGTLQQRQDAEWSAFEFASTLNRNAALQSISMGAPQILGSHFRRLGYPTPEAMFRAFGDRQSGQAAQMIGFTNFVLSSSSLFRAIKNKDFHTVARIYNGPGQAEHYANLMRNEYRRLGGTI